VDLLSTTQHYTRVLTRPIRTQTWHTDYQPDIPLSPGSTLSSSSKGPNPNPINWDLFQRASDCNTIQHHQRQDHNLAYTRQTPNQPLGPITSPHGPPPLTRTKFCRKSARKIVKARKKSLQPHPPAFLDLTVTTLSSTNITLAGVAQSVERVALITAKRSTSRSWVRAPPSAIPIIQALQSSCSFALLIADLTGSSYFFFGFRSRPILVLTDHQLFKKTMKHILNLHRTRGIHHSTIVGYFIDRSSKYPASWTKSVVKHQRNNQAFDFFMEETHGWRKWRFPQILQFPC
jgi:hypothetical protein